MSPIEIENEYKKHHFLSQTKHPLNISLKFYPYKDTAISSHYNFQPVFQLKMTLCLIE